MKWGLYYDVVLVMVTFLLCVIPLSKLGSIPFLNIACIKLNFAWLLHRKLHMSNMSNLLLKIWYCIYNSKLCYNNGASTTIVLGILYII